MARSYLIYYIRESSRDAQVFSLRPKGPAEWSPGLSPQGDALGNKPQSPCGLKGRENPSWIAPSGEQSSRGPSGRIRFAEPLPRESAYGLIPGLRSPGLLGRVGWLGLRASAKREPALGVSQLPEGAVEAELLEDLL